MRLRTRQQHRSRSGVHVEGRVSHRSNILSINGLIENVELGNTHYTTIVMGMGGYGGMAGWGVGGGGHWGIPGRDKHSFSPNCGQSLINRTLSCVFHEDVDFQIMHAFCMFWKIQ